MTISNTDTMPPLIKQSRAKIAMRTFIIAVFGTIFGISLYHDMASGIFRWQWVLVIIVLNAGIGFLMSNLVPMQVHKAFNCITLSFDRVYFIIIFSLVVAKTVAAQWLGILFLSDIIMCVLLGLMGGRLIGTCIRIRKLKVMHDLI